MGLDFKPEPGLADNGDLEHDLQALLEAAGQAAQAAGTVIAMFVDELQYVEEEQLAALITAPHRTSQQRLPVVLVGAGLPQLRARMGRAKSYAERMFDFPEIGPLSDEAARRAIAKPLDDEGVEITPAALTKIMEITGGYAYFLQEWGKHAWNATGSSPIGAEDVAQASITAIAALDESFFRVRFDRLTPSEKRYLQAMADLGQGPHRSGDIAEVLDRKVTSLAPARSQLISKGMIWSPHHGDTAFTVPLFDEFMHRMRNGVPGYTTDARRWSWSIPESLLPRVSLPHGVNEVSPLGPMNLPLGVPMGKSCDSKWTTAPELTVAVAGVWSMPGMCIDC